MTVPTSITTELASLQAQVVAASPLNAAPAATLTAIRLNAANLVKDIQQALVAPANILDTFVASSDPVSIISAVLVVASAAQDQYTLSLMRGVCGRAASNIDQVV